MGKRIIKRCVSFFMAVLLLFFMLPLETLSLKAEEAKTPVVYREYNIETKEWEIKNCSEYQVLTDLDKTLNEGWYIVSGEVTCNNVLTVEGNVCLILTDDERVIIRTKLEKPSKIKGLALI